MNKINNYKNKLKIYSINIKKVKNNMVPKVFITIVRNKKLINQFKIEIKLS